MFKRIIKLTAALGISFSLMGGVALADSSITNTGPHSFNSINNFSFSYKKSVKVNDASVTNISVQGGGSGDAIAVANTTAGNVSTGNVHNTNTTTTTIVQSN